VTFFDHRLAVILGATIKADFVAVLIDSVTSGYSIVMYFVLVALTTIKFVFHQIGSYRRYYLS